MPLTNTKPSCQTVSGGYIEPCNPDPVDIHIGDIGHCLALANRWAGNTQYIEDGDGVKAGDPFVYTVAQHSCHVHDIVVRRFGAPSGYYALMHDSSEAYLMDVPRPIKPELTNYYEIEAQLMGVILDKFGVPFSPEIKAEVVEIDNAIIFWERDAIVGQPVAPYGHEDQHPGGTIYDQVPSFCSWSPKRAKAEFLWRFRWHNECPIMFGEEAFATHLTHFVNDELGFTSKLQGFAHYDHPKVA